MNAHPQGVPEKPSGGHGHADHPADVLGQQPPASSFHLNTIPYAISDGLASLKLLVCPGCLTRWEQPEGSGYQALPQCNPCDYATNKPYVAEKPPSAQLPGSGSYMPASIISHQSSSFASEPTVTREFVPNYPPLPETSPLTADATTGQDSIFFPAHTSVATADFYSHQPTVSQVSTQSQARDGFYGHEQLASDHVTSISYPNGSTTGVSRQTQLSTGQTRFISAYPLTDSGFKRDPTESQGPSPVSKLDVVFPNQKPPAARRGPFKDPEKREQTAQTRRIGSCIRCRMQRIRCQSNPKTPDGPCLTCTGKQPSKVWRIPCLRVKLTDVRLFKPGQVHGYEWTQRWKDSIVDNIANWASPEEKWIKLSEGLTPTSVELRVRKFIPQDGDRLERSWVHQGVRCSVPIPPYAIIDLGEAQEAYSEYIRSAVGSMFVSVIDSVIGTERNLLWRTYHLAWMLSRHPNAEKDERELLRKALELWMAIRLTTRSTVIVGEETLGMDRNIMDKTSPQHGKIPLPPVMGAQIDMILITHIQSRLRREMLDMLQKMTQATKQKTWLTTYLVTFILLHNIALITDHDARYAKKHGMKRRWARDEEVKEYIFGAVILLSYFHYCNKGVFPFTDQCRDQDLQGLAELNENEMHFVHQTRIWATAHSESSPAHPL
ncbi:hypothetical protein SODALDRAFT_273925 [Sodiomyces alkalinus F11]|uniref:Zn(2)-C6 fungal-type domain-containing protein n=1 Tax=Sodiomyces alkalinus (strain CBS 110278 / VKM F-3762 / F11) TaxID=1314773 RepID=A0A3N2PZY4_SODAK|nr:hypothetical protein SODALDRAFT_273925 [Sodiomyces alkalinus F11]ROT40074.1 hypothetical protein SODALDRAFT_273925 [Sodiomyces alkalinus F11]